MTDGNCKIRHFPKLRHCNFLFQTLFSMKSNWALDCMTRGRYPDGGNTVQHTHDCDVGQMA
jgi:hypothetical protein